MSLDDLDYDMSDVSSLSKRCRVFFFCLWVGFLFRSYLFLVLVLVLVLVPVPVPVLVLVLVLVLARVIVSVLARTRPLVSLLCRATVGAVDADVG